MKWVLLGPVYGFLTPINEIGDYYGTWPDVSVRVQLVSGESLLLEKKTSLVIGRT